MILYCALLVLACVFGARSIINLFKSRFPHPADVATISIFYYGVPLSVAGFFSLNYGGMVFLNAAAGDPELALWSMQYIVAALISLHLGRVLGVAIGPASFREFSSLSRDAENRTRILFAAQIAILALGVYLFGLREFFSGYAAESFQGSASTGNALIYTVVETLGITIAFTMILGRVSGRIPLKIWILASILFLVIVLGVRAKRLEVVAAFIPAAILLLSRRSSLKASSWRFLGGGLAIAGLVIISALRASDTLDPFRIVYYFFSEGIYAGHSLPGIVERIAADTIDYEKGARIINALLGFIPRFLWEGKDNMVYAGNLILEGVAPLGATSLLAEVVLQGSYIAVAICYFVMGAIFQRLAMFETVWDEALKQGLMPSRFAGYIIAIAIFIPHFRDGIIPAVKLSLQAGVFFIILLGLQRHRSNRTAHHGPNIINA